MERATDQVRIEEWVDFHLPADLVLLKRADTFAEQVMVHARVRDTDRESKTGQSFLNDPQIGTWSQVPILSSP